MHFDMISIIMNQTQPIPDPFTKLPAKTTRHIVIGKRRLLFRLGNRPQHLCHLADSAVSMLRHTASGQVVTLHRAKPDEMMAEVSLFTDQYHRDCVAEKDSQVFAFQKSAVLELLSKDVGFASALIQRFARQVQSYRRQLELRDPVSKRPCSCWPVRWLAGGQRAGLCR